MGFEIRLEVRLEGSVQEAPVHVQLTRTEATGLGIRPGDRVRVSPHPDAELRPVQRTPERDAPSSLRESVPASAGRLTVCQLEAAGVGC